jgi:ATP-dependent Zn protease
MATVPRGLWRGCCCVFAANEPLGGVSTLCALSSQHTNDKSAEFIREMTATKKELRQRTAYHEASHCAAALVYGVPVHGISIDPRRPYFSRGSIRQHKELAIEVVAAICLAGPAGEEFFFGPGPVTDEGAQTDLRMARTYLEPCYPEIMIGAHLQRLHTAAERLVRDARPRIRAIADALMTKTRLSGDEIYELAIRAGKWSGDATASSVTSLIPGILD